jgi:hypothetical protein
VILFLLFSLQQWICSESAGKKERVLMRYSAITLYILFFGFRGFIGADWNNYYPYYSKIPSLLSGHFGVPDYSFEIGFTLFSAICKTISSNYHFFIFTNTLVNVILIDIFIRRHLPARQYVLGIMIFLLMGGIMNEIDLLRSSKAVLLFMVSIKYIQSRQLLKFLLINIVGLSFHAMAIIFFPLYFIVNCNFSSKVMILIWIIGNIIFLLQIQYIKPILSFLISFLGMRYSEKLSAYLSSNIFNTAYGFSLGFIERTFSFLMLVIFYKRLYKQGDYPKIFINIFYFFILCNLFFGEFYIVQARVGLMLSFIYLIIWPMLYSMQKKYIRPLFLFVFGVYLIIKIISYTGSVIYRYDNVITGIEPYKERQGIYNSSYMDILRKKRGN